MIGARFRTILPSATEYIALGPLWCGIVVRGVFLQFNQSAAATIAFGVSACGGGDETAENLAAGVALVVSDAAGVGMPAGNGFMFDTAASAPWSLVVPIYMPVESGVRYVLVGCRAGSQARLLCGLIVEPERLVRPAMEPGPAARRLRSNGRVLEELRAEALAAVV